MKLLSDEKHDLTEISLNDYSYQLNLTVRRLSRDDFGSYTCSAENLLGKAEGTIRLQGKRAFDFYVLSGLLFWICSRLKTLSPRLSQTPFRGKQLYRLLRFPCTIKRDLCIRGRESKRSEVQFSVDDTNLDVLFMVWNMVEKFNWFDEIDYRVTFNENNFDTYPSQHRLHG